MSNYNYYKPKIQKSDISINYKAPTVENVENAFKAIYDSSDFLSFDVNKQIPTNRYCKINKTHFQGIQRLQNSNYLVISGGDSSLKNGHLFVVKMESRNPDTALHSNIFHNDKLPAKGLLDRIILTLNVNDDIHGVDSEKWHVGGISISGDLLVAPAESPKGGSVILFYNFSNPEQPLLLSKKTRIMRPHAQSGAVAITDLPNGHLILAIHGKHEDSKHYIDFYLSKQSNMSESFNKLDSYELDDDYPSYQNINFVKNSSGELFLVGTGNSNLAPLFNTEDYVNLYKVLFNTKKLNNICLDKTKVNQLFKCLKTRKLKNKVIRKGKRKFTPFQSNMCASGGMYIHTNGALFLYSSYHFRDPKDKSRIRMAEFRPQPKLYSQPIISSISESWIEFFGDKNYEEIRLSVNGSKDTSIKDFYKLSAQGYIFGKKLSSLRVQIPKDKKLVLYAQKDFGTKKGFHVIIGTGKIICKPDLKKLNFNDKTLSCRIIDISHTV